MPRERDRQFSGGIDLAKDRLRNRLSAIHAAVERGNQRAGTLRHAGDAQRFGGDEHCDDGLPQRDKPFKERFLRAGERKVRAIPKLSRLLDDISHGKHNHVRLPRRRNRRVQIVRLARQRPAAARIGYRDSARVCHHAHAFQQRHIWARRGRFRARMRMGKIRPVAILRANVVGICAEHRDLANLVFEWQHAIVFEQRDALPRGKERAFPVRRAADAIRRAAILRLLKEPHRKLHAQDVSNRLVQHALRQRAAFHKADCAVIKRGGGHHHVVARARGKQGRLVHVVRHVLFFNQAVDVVPVRYDKAFKPELPAQDVPHRFFARGKRRTVDGAVSGHNRRHARLHRALKRREERLLELSKRHFGVAGIPPADSVAIADIVLRTGKDVFAVCDVLSLIAADDRRAQLARQIRVFAKRFVDPAPAGVTPKAEHGRKRPMQPVRRNFPRGYAAHLLRNGGVPTARRRKLGRKDRSLLVEPVPVNRVDAKQHRDAEACAQRKLLNLPRVVTQHMQKGACAALSPVQRFLA